MENKPMDASVVELGKEGTITLPQNDWQDLPPGTRLLVHREQDSIVLQVLRGTQSTPFDLSPETLEFANELVTEQRNEYLAQLALASL